ncbi:efflux RND transporter periplasmic adaptor subunit [bacterium]|nr:efflux RND transporter periplasmic adaptor subunit [bacterium]
MKSSKKISSCHLKKKITIPFIILLLLLGLALKSTVTPQPLRAQTTTCDHDHHKAKPASQLREHNKEHDLKHNEHNDHDTHEEHEEIHALHGHTSSNPDEHDSHNDCNHDHDHTLKNRVTPSASQHDLESSHVTTEVHVEESCSVEAIHMSRADMNRFGIVVQKAAAGQLETRSQARGEIFLNRDRMAQIVPKVSGTVKEIHRTLGDVVEKGEVMAIIESQELADAKTDYLSAIKHLELTKTVFQREKKLWHKKINSEQNYLSAKKNLAAAKITHASCKQKLIVLGLSHTELSKLPSEPIAMLSRLIVRSPFSGDVINKNIVLGETLTDTIPIFTVADLNSVWVDLDLYIEDAGKIGKGNKVIISLPGEKESITAVIDYVAPLVDLQTRTTKARIILDNHDRKARPGSFITAEIITGKISAGVVVRESMVQDVDGKKCIFVQDDHGFEPRPVILGATSGNMVEIKAGIHPGEMIVSQNSFRLKAALETGVGSGCSSPGHAH